MSENSAGIDPAVYADFIASAVRRVCERRGSMEAAISDAEAMVLALSAIVTNERGLARLRAIFDGALRAAEIASQERARVVRGRLRVVTGEG